MQSENHDEVMSQPIAMASAEGEQQEENIENDPFAPSYPESAIQYLPYRIGIIIFAIFMIIIGKSNLPSDQVDCIQDIVINWFQPIANFYNANPGFGLTLVSIMQLVVDIQLVLMLAYWFWRGESVRYPLLLSILGLSKVLLNVLFQSRPISNSFNQQAFPSIVFGTNFANTYFFSGVICLMLLNVLQLYELDFKRLFKAQIGILIYVAFVLMTTRQNYFMDVITAVVFMHYVFYFIQDRLGIIDGFFFKVYDWVTGNHSSEDKYLTQRAKEGIHG